MENSTEPKGATSLQSDIEASIEGISVDTSPQAKFEAPTFPEGGLRAWSVAIGCGGVLFCGFGYVNAFGCVPFYLQES
jgi:hypothetical protein